MQILRKFDRISITPDFTKVSITELWEAQSQHFLSSLKVRMMQWMNPELSFLRVSTLVCTTSIQFGLHVLYMQLNIYIYFFFQFQKLGMVIVQMSDFHSYAAL